MLTEHEVAAIQRYLIAKNAKTEPTKADIAIVNWLRRGLCITNVVINGIIAGVDIEQFSADYSEHDWEICKNVMLLKVSQRYSSIIREELDCISAPKKNKLVHIMKQPVPQQHTKAPAAFAPKPVPTSYPAELVFVPLVGAPTIRDKDGKICAFEFSKKAKQAEESEGAPEPKKRLVAEIPD